MGPLLVFLFFAAVVGLIIYTIVSKVRDDGPNGRVVSWNVEVVSKRTQLTVVSSDKPTTTTYIVAFRPLHLRRAKEFVVDQQQYEAMTEGEVGTLQHKGWQFISFTPSTQTSRT